MSDDDLIGLPPGFTPPDPDSGTVRRERTERPRSGEDIVFFPTAPGMAPPPAAAPVVAPTVAEHDDATVASIPRRAGATWRLVLDGREPVTIDGTLFLGRNPVATAGHPGSRVLAVDDASKSVSKTHAMLELDAGELWVHDLDSTNGVWVVPLGGEAIEVVPGARAIVPAGSELELGDLVIQIERG